MAADFRPVAPVDPTNLRPMLFLDVAREMMLGDDWSHRAVTVVMESHTGPGRFTFYGANHPDIIDEVHAGLVDVSILNPAAMLPWRTAGPARSTPSGTWPPSPCCRTTTSSGSRSRPGSASPASRDIAERRYPLRVSVRGSIDACTPIMVDVVLREHGFTLSDIERVGRRDQLRPAHA